MILMLIVALTTGLIIYGGCRVALWMHTENRTVRLRRGAMVSTAAAALFVIGYALLSRSRVGDEPGGALFVTIPFLVASVTGFLVGLHLLLSGPRGEYLP